MEFGLQNIDEAELRSRALLNKSHFEALSHWLQSGDIENEILNNRYFNSIRNTPRADRATVEMWLKNSWNTEVVMVSNMNIIQNTGQSFSMQWVFPQVYYACFGSIMALYISLGYTENSHSGVLRKYGQLMQEGKLPNTVSLCCDGSKNCLTYLNISKPDSGFGDIYRVDLSNDLSVRYHICTFLSSTRKKRLAEKAPTLKLKNKQGMLKKALNNEDWIKVSASLGPTTYIDHLYRKRIKSNYQDIESFSTPYFDGESVLNSLIIILTRTNLVNETYIAKAIGVDNFEKMVLSHTARIKNPTLSERLEIIRTILS